MIRPRHLLVAVAAAACTSAPPPRPAQAPAPSQPPAAASVTRRTAAARPLTGLEIVVVPPDAEVEIEGVRRAPASAIASGTAGVVPLAPGVYRVSVRHPGYATWRAELSVGNDVERIDVTLAEQR